ncbi:MAG: BrxA/BrxB family bacilliredoxin [Candidatus Hydrogenedentes bacterium]|nr:BrxA/BrxB family bacilliredoxin [Candidatus Hydrogenedentota bacterium]MBI3117048.1 BrxA/BrxB family bacilliredoxin [Candidatus Hydrogenedentota bacterium]
MPALYDPEQVRPMWEELAAVGIRPLKSAQEVDAVLKDTAGTALVVVNSVCGCAAGGARPGVTLALQNDIIPDELATVFAGMDTEATQRAREYMANVQPSSPCIALFKDGKPLHVLERRHIERMSALDIANNLKEIFNQTCSRKGPSVPPEVFEANEHVEICGSTLTRVNAQ